ncbi:uncharacterized protein EAF02_009325 [Botrytis sinoallii]|uniref:uncharacterized protein n=1 Tax=Botrytis sinoallii TaxID=1463999 RepID=UPI0019029EE1|nr:uncharacterized protein EAF02_009325 [Botrytis sinoallii]KAF7870135.1 hypothetical protein EAF02_009325 [Botrytis sinoallii]
MPAMQYSANHLEFLDFVPTVCTPYFYTKYGAVPHKSEVSEESYRFDTTEKVSTYKRQVRSTYYRKDGDVGSTDSSFGQPYD